MTILTQNTISSASQIHLNHRVIQRQYAQSIKIIQYQTWMLVSSDSLYKLFSFTWLLTTLLHRVISLYEYGAQETPTRMVVSHATNMVPFFSVDALFTYNSSPTTLYQDCSAFPSPAVFLYSKNKHRKQEPERRQGCRYRGKLSLVSCCCTFFSCFCQMRMMPDCCASSAYAGWWTSCWSALVAALFPVPV